MVKMGTKTMQSEIEYNPTVRLKNRTILSNCVTIEFWRNVTRSQGKVKGGTGCADDTSQGVHASYPSARS